MYDEFHATIFFCYDVVLIWCLRSVFDDLSSIFEEAHRYWNLNDSLLNIIRKSRTGLDFDISRNHFWNSNNSWEIFNWVSFSLRFANFSHALWILLEFSWKAFDNLGDVTKFSKMWTIFWVCKFQFSVNCQSSEFNKTQYHRVALTLSLPLSSISKETWYLFSSDKTKVDFFLIFSHWWDMLLLFVGNQRERKMT